MYNIMHGVNPASLILLRSLDLHHYKLNPNGKWPTGRFRDIHISGDGTKVILFTRNGGGNRECWENKGCPIWDRDNETYKDFQIRNIPENHDSGCLVYVNWRLSQHPLYIGDYDDDYDSTYAYFEFKMPEKLDPMLDELLEVQGGEQKSLWEKTQAVLEEMESMSKEELEQDERFKPLMDAVKQIKEFVEK